jgi:Transposase DNA-binding/Transposase Tn5 dimerisation domain
MEVAELVSAPEWARQTFATVRLGDRRRTQRVVQMAEVMARRPAGTLPQQMQSEAALHGAYRVLQCPDVHYEQLIAPHLEQSREAASQHLRVLLIQDTTEVDYQQHPKTQGLGPIGNNSHHGYLLQSVLAMEPQSRQILGLVHQEPFLRQTAPKGERQWQRLQRERESQIWERSVQQIGPPPAGVQWIHVGDRGADIFPLLVLCRQLESDFVIRACQDRCVDLLVHDPQAPFQKRPHRQARPGDPARASLFEVARQWPAIGEQELELPTNQKRKQRVAHLRMSVGQVRLLPPQDPRSRDLAPQVVWVVRAWEVEAPDGVEALEWMLLTSVAVENAAQGWERVEWYRGRWTVEDYHQGLKTGCRVQARHLHDYESLRRLLGLLAPMAVRLLQVRAAARQDPQAPARQHLPREVVGVVAHLAQVPAAQLSMQQCWFTIAKKGGYLGRRGDGPPGWKTLWLGWMEIQSLIEGVHLAAQLQLE